MMAVICIANCQRSFSKLKVILSYLWATMTNNKSGQVLRSSCDDNRKGRNSEACFDEITDDFAVLISIFV